MNAPCKGCTDRELGCHGTCERYKDYRIWREKIRQNKADAGFANEITSMSIQRIQRKLLKKVRR